MNFFESQDRARRKTGQLVLLFIVAAISLIVLSNLLLGLVGATVLSSAEIDGSHNSAFTWQNHALISLAIITVIAVASLYKIAKLSGGGEVVALSLGGRLLPQSANDPDERRLLNIVEEMAIASGLPVPPVYILDDEALNAFAAGFQPDDAIIGVTRGCIRYLNREELQGVVAHEFSHILHGDMRINIRLIGVLYGILVIGTVGSYLLRASAHRSSGYRSSSKNDGAPIALLGLALIVIGYSGTFFGGLIKASVSRQREYLADASAVQYTRNPDGIAGALKKIGGFRFGSRILAPNAAEASHLFIGQVIKLSSLMATHPPIDERIRRLQPSWNGELIDSEEQFRSHTINSFTEQTVAGQRMAFDQADIATGGHNLSPVNGVSVLDSIGDIAPAHLDYAHNLLEQLRGEIREAIKRPSGAREAIYCLLISKDEGLLAKQLHIVQKYENGVTKQKVEKLLPKIQQLGVEFRIPIIDLCLPVLKRQYDDQQRRFRECVLELMRADNNIDLFEWCLHRLFMRHLEAGQGHRARNKTKYNKLDELQEECQIVISALAERGAANASAVNAAFNEAIQTLEFKNNLNSDVELREKRSLADIDRALNKLCSLAPLEKPKFIKACARCALDDGVVNPEEFELLRAIADSMDVPLPPRLEAQALI